MATVPNLTADASPTTDDLLYVINAPGGTPADRKVTIGNLLTAWSASSPTFAGLTLTGNLALGSGTITTTGTAALGATTVTGNLTVSSKVIGTTANGYLDLFGDSGATKGLRVDDSGNLTVATGSIFAWTSSANVYLQESSGSLFAGTNGGFVFALDTARNFLLGTATTPTSATRNLVLSVDATAATAITDGVSIYAKDRSAGNTMLGFRQEGTAFLTGTPAASTGAWAVEINGTTVYLEGSTTAPS